MAAAWRFPPPRRPPRGFASARAADRDAALALLRHDIPNYAGMTRDSPLGSAVEDCVKHRVIAHEVKPRALGGMHGSSGIVAAALAGLSTGPG